jgi:hypothetical protein
LPNQAIKSINHIDLRCDNARRAGRTEIVFRLGIWLAVTLVMFLNGCRPLKDTNREASTNPLLKTFRMAPNNVALEVAIAEFDADALDDLLSQIEPYLDRQRISLDQRRRWDDNGLQVGAFSSQIPGVLRDALETRELTLAELQDMGLTPTDNATAPLTRTPVIFHRRMQFKTDEPKPIPLSEYYPRAAWEIKLPEGRSLRSDDQVRGWMMTSIELGKGGTVNLQLTPRLTHGHLAKRVTVFQQSFVNEESQSETDVHELMMQINLSPGESMLVFSRSEAGELGDLLLGSQQRERDSQNSDSPARPTARLLFLRVIQTQHDDLFTPPQLK